MKRAVRTLLPALSGLLAWSLPPEAAAQTPIPAWVVEERSRDASSLTSPISLTPLADGSMLLLAQTRRERRLVVATRLDASGSILSEAVVDGLVPSPYWRGEIAVDPRGYLVGFSAIAHADGPTYRVVKCSAESGRRLWTSSVEPLSDDWIGIDENGDALIAGFEGLSSGRVLKLSGTDGRLVWGPVVVPARLLDGPLNGGVLFDSNGGVLLVTEGVASRLNGATGEPSWSVDLGRVRTGGGIAPNGDIVLVTPGSVSRFDALTGARRDGASFRLWHGGDRAFVLGNTPGGNVAVLCQGRVAVPPFDELHSQVNLVDPAGGGVLLEAARYQWRGIGWDHRRNAVLASPGGDIILAIPEVPVPWHWQTSYASGWLLPYRIAVERISATGASSWTREVDGEYLGESSADGPSRIAMAPDGSIWLARVRWEGLAAGSSIVVERMDPRTGQLLGATPVRAAALPLVYQLLRDRAGDALIAIATETSEWFDHYLYGQRKLRGSDGRELWSRTDRSDSWALADDGVGGVLAVRFDAEAGTSRLERYAAADGSTLWSVPTPGTLRVRLDRDGNVIESAVGHPSSIRVLDIFSGALRKVVPLEREPTSELEPSGADVVIQEVSPDRWYEYILYKLDLTTGERVWQARTPLRHLSRVGDDILAFDFGVMERLDGGTGALLWRRQEVATFGSAVLADAHGDVFVAYLDAGGRAGAGKLDGATGAWLWRVSLTEGTQEQLSGIVLDLHGNLLVPRLVPSEDGWTLSVRALRGSDGSVLFETRGVPSMLVPPLLVPIEGGFLSVIIGPEADAVVSYSFGLGLLAAWPGRPSALQAAICGAPAAYELGPVGGVPPYSLTIISGRVPPGLTLNARTGSLGGVPGSAGTFDFGIRLTDAAGTSADAAFVLDVGEASPALPIVAELLSPPCTPSLIRLSSPEADGSLRWLPGGESTPSILVSPEHPTTYGLVATDVTGCTRTGFRLVAPPVLSDDQRPAIQVPASAVIHQNACADYGSLGATPGRSAALAAFLNGATATDDCGFIRPLPTMFQGGIVNPETFFPVGSNRVTFRYLDAAGNGSASEGSFTVRRLGDLDLSDRVDVFDAAVLMSALVGNLSPGVAPFAAEAVDADTTRDGTLDVRDLVLLMAHVAGNVGCLTP